MTIQGSRNSIIGLQPLAVSRPIRTARGQTASRAIALQKSKFFCSCLLLIFFLAGCATPNKANIELRKKIATLQTQITGLKNRNNVLTAQIVGMQQSATTLPSLPLSRLDLLFTAHGLTISRLSDGADLYHENHGQTGIRLYVSPIDDMGNPIQATGTFTIDAYDLANPGHTHIGHWVITPEQCKDAWSLAFLRAAYYTFDLPYQQLPKHSKITVHVKFMDELTGRLFTAQRVVDVEPTNSRLIKAATRPAQAQ